MRISDGSSDVCSSDLKQSRLGLGTNRNQSDRDIMQQDTAWYERQLINTQLVAEFDFDRIQLDLRGAYANSQREAPYERIFTYVRTNLPTDLDPVGAKFVNDLTAGRRSRSEERRLGKDVGRT